MNETLKSWLILFLIVAITILLGITLYLYLRRKYTKERFAFFAVVTLAALAFTIVAPILASQSIWGILALSINQIFGFSIPYEEPSFSEQALAVIIFIVCSNFLLRIHRNWDSEVISKRQYENDKRNRNSGIYRDFIAQSKAFLNPKYKLELFDPKQNSASQNILGTLENEKLPWHENVAEILELTSTQYKINIDSDWYKEQKCFISEYGKEDHKIHIYCFLGNPTNEEVKKIIENAKRESKVPTKIIITIEEWGNNSEVEYEGFEISYRYKNEMLDSLIDFSNYKNYIQKRFSKSEIDIGTDLTISDMYVSSTGIFESDKGDVGSVEKYVLDWVYEKSNKHLAVLGQYGQGKSILALKTTYELLFNSNKRIPILMELRGKSPRNLSPLEIIATWSSNFRIEPQAILKLHNEGKLLLIFEGFDEMDLVGDAEMRMNHFRNL